MYIAHVQKNNRNNNNNSMEQYAYGSHLFTEYYLIAFLAPLRFRLNTNRQINKRTIKYLHRM